MDFTLMVTPKYDKKASEQHTWVTAEENAGMMKWSKPIFTMPGISIER